MKKLISPGRAFAAASSSRTERTPRAGAATRTYFEVAVCVTPARSFSVSYASFG